MPRVFISHNTADKERFVNGLAERLRDAGVEVWYDKWELLPGDSLVDLIFNEGLGHSDVVIAVLSSNSIESNWVRKELNVATIKTIWGQCKIIPVVLDGVPVPESLIDTLYQQIPDTDSYDEEFGLILAGISRPLNTAAVGKAQGLRPGNKTPHQLPVAPRRFVNRERELARLDGVLNESKGATYPCVAVLVGLPGMGKSALAAHWSNSVRGEFSDGELYIDFAPRGSDTVPDIGDIMASLLRDLGVVVDAVPADLASQRATFERLTDSKRLLIVAENISEAAQLKLALPQGHGSMVVATTNHYIGELAIDGAEMVELQALDRDDAIAVLKGISGSRNRDDSHEELGELSDVCGGLPIALAVCGAQLGHHPKWSVRDLIDDIRSADDALVALGGDHSHSFKRAVDAVYRSFGDDLRHFYGSLDLFPGQTLGIPTSAVIAGVAPHEADRMLRALHDAQLLIEVEPHRYQAHGLVREHMKTAFAEVASPGDAEQRGADLVEWYYGSVRCADLAIAENRLRIAPDEEIASPVEFPRFESPSQPFEWYMMERHNIVAVMHLADRLGLHHRVWQMAVSLWRMFSDQRLLADWRECDLLGVEAAVMCENRDAEARLRSELARALAELGEHEQAQDEMSLSRKLVEQSENLTLRASVTEFHGTCAFLAGLNTDAMAAYDSARAQMQELGNERGVAIADLQRCRVFTAMGRYPDALDTARRCQSAFEQLGDTANTAKAAFEVVRALRGSEESGDVSRELQWAIDMLEQSGLDFHLAQAHELSAQVYATLRNPQEAARHRQSAYRLFRKLGHQHAERLEPLVLADSG